MATHAQTTSDPMVVVRWLDLLVLVLALPVFVVAGFSLTGYATGAGVWLAQRALQVAVQRRAEASSEPRTIVGLTAGSMLVRGWLVALTILLVGLGDNDAGLAAAVLVIVLFTIYFNASLILRAGAPSR
jgi:hypothetical protein